jgi:3-phosphoshikimate 1-carboxyvinyltransferase
MKKIKARPLVNSTLRMPGSKSVTHRALISASLASGESWLYNFLKCEDTCYTIDALRQLGVDISIEGEGLKVEGTGGKFQPVSTRKELYLGNSGTTIRLLLSVVALCHGEFLLTGTERMLKRPMGHLVTALNQLGVETSCVGRNGCPPVLIRAHGISGGRVSISGDESSQFISSLLLSGPCAQNDIQIEVTGKLISRPYVDITLEVMEQFGIKVARDSYSSFKVASGQPYRSREHTIEGDTSSASYFWAAAAVTGGTVVTTNIYPYSTRQGDIRFLEILEKMGCIIEKKLDRVVVHGGRLRAIEADMSSMPDMVPTLAAIALFSSGESVIRNVHHLRHKESDRLRAIALEWNRLGAGVEEIDGGLVIHGGRRLTGTMLDPHNDHRVAMSLAVVGLRVPGIRIINKECVQKSFPQFWQLWNRL